ncbi:DUF928 domain-containing protein [Nostoc sp. FACHB-110]|uniref:DUF928 domain-containing protein n=1 Tax=Nostoc sp. FACHB-110 TaxID=2692834 RepID=UPI0016894C14|nr:DUF928 domain-containing protein [Nostoc sp. FACHB-110]
MKPVFLSRCFCVAFILGSLLPVSLNASLANPPGTLQARLDYNQYMQLGYTATRQRNYSEALDYFRQALYERPGDRYATLAISNIGSYISRDRRSSTKRKTYITFIPSNLGIATKRTPAATRSDQIRSESGEVCIQSKKRLTAIIPGVDVLRTTQANPSFFFYVPQTSAPVMELVLQNEQEEVIYQKTLPVPSKPGIVSFSLPPTDANFAGLQVGQSYQWYFSLICDRHERSSDYVIKGDIARLAPNNSVNSQLATANLEEQATIYALSGIWENALTIVAQLRKSHPNDLAIKNDWEDLLRSGDLEPMINEPLLP